MRALGRRLLLTMVWLIPVGVFAQAVLAGQGWFTGAAVFELHGGIGHGVLLLSVLSAALAWLLRSPRGLALLTTTGVLLLVVQTGLGYAGRRGGLEVASAWHIPLGVAVFGLTLAAALLLSTRTHASAQHS